MWGTGGVGGGVVDSDQGDGDGGGCGAARGSGGRGGLYLYDLRRGHEKALVRDEVVESVTLTPDFQHMMLITTDNDTAGGSGKGGNGGDHDPEDLTYQVRVLVAGKEPYCGADGDGGDGDGDEWADSAGWDEPGPVSGLIDLDRIGAIAVDPLSEWTLIYDQA